MNYANPDQLKAVAASCSQFNSNEIAFTNFIYPNDVVSCTMCNNWDGTKCTINVFDSVLTSLDQT